MFWLDPFDKASSFRNLLQQSDLLVFPRRKIHVLLLKSPQIKQTYSSDGIFKASPSKIATEGPRPMNIPTITYINSTYVFAPIPHRKTRMTPYLRPLQTSGNLSTTPKTNRQPSPTQQGKNSEFRWRKLRTFRAS